MATASLLGGLTAAAQGLDTTKPKSSAASGTGGTSGSSSASNSATISANDFLSLLVTEMQNQDPTATTDPNQYINQLVNVNSLEQLISINQNLSTALGVTPTGGAASPSATAANVSSAGAATTGNSSEPAVHAVSSPLTHATLQPVSGNLSIPVGIPAAQRVAQSLGGHSSGS